MEAPTNRLQDADCRRWMPNYTVLMRSVPAHDKQPALVHPRAYVPDASDVVWLEFDPQAGYEQSGHLQRQNRLVSADVMPHVRAKMKALLQSP